MDKIDLLENIIITNLKEIKVNNGNVLHALKNDEHSYKGFGEAYFSFVNYNCIKAWKKHNVMHINLIVPIGIVRFVFYDELTNKFRVEEIGKNNYARLTIPKGIFFGFKGIDKPSNLILNIANIKHDPNEVISKPVDYFKYDW